MALIDVIKCDVLDNNDWLVWKTPITDLRLGTQLIVNNNQRAVLVKGGKVCDYFEAGTHTLSTNNIPILNKIVNLPFGGKTPFSAEVWYFNLSDKRNQKWGTQSPIDVMDPTLGFPFSLRSCERPLGNSSQHSVFRVSGQISLQSCWPISVIRIASKR